MGTRTGSGGVDLEQRPAVATDGSEGNGGRPGNIFLAVVVILFLATTLPVVLNSAPLLDDFSRCAEPQLPGYWKDHYEEWGIVRPVTTVEVGVINFLCNRVPFGWAILINLALTLGVAYLTVGLLKDLGLRSPWPQIGGALWLLFPLGTETALWPSVMHVPLGLALAIGSARAFHRGRLIVGISLALASFLSLEQMILALPFVVWLVTPKEKRNVAALTTGVLAIVVLGAYSLAPGSDEGHAIGIGERLRNLVAVPSWYASFPGVGLGAHSIPYAILWALPFSVLALAVGGGAGWFYGPSLLRRGDPPDAPKRRWWPLLLALVVIVCLLNVPFATGNHEDSPRHFAPTWFALSVFGAIAGSRIKWSRERLLGAVGGVLIAGAVLSLAWSSWVRIRTSDIMEATYADLETRLPDDAEVAICGVTRTVVDPAPGGDFAVHDFLGGPGEGFGDEAYLYFTDRVATFSTGGFNTETNCPDVEDPDVTLDFQELIVNTG